jgi:hypothetical protein
MTIKNVDRFCWFRGICSLHLQGRRIRSDVEKGGERRAKSEEIETFGNCGP